MNLKTSTSVPAMVAGNLTSMAVGGAVGAVGNLTAVKNLQAEFYPAAWNGVDASGIRVVGKAILVLMDECAEVTSGGIHIPSEAIEKFNAGCETGRLVATSPGAFRVYEDMTPWTGTAPKPGDRVYIEKYAGKLVKGKDGRTYRLMDYQSVGAVYD